MRPDISETRGSSGDRAAESVMLFPSTTWYPCGGKGGNSTADLVMTSACTFAVWRFSRGRVARRLRIADERESLDALRERAETPATGLPMDAYEA